jgi:hypothetical protein
MVACSNLERTAQQFSLRCQSPAQPSVVTSDGKIKDIAPEFIPNDFLTSSIGRTTSCHDYCDRWYANSYWCFYQKIIKQVKNTQPLFSWWF